MTEQETTEQTSAVAATRRGTRRGRGPSPRARVQRAVVYLLLALVAFVIIVPLMWAFSASLTPTELIFKYAYPFTWRALFPLDFTLDAYRELFTLNEGLYPRAVLNTLILGFSTVFLSASASAMAGFAFARFEFPGRNLLFGLVLLTFMIPAPLTTIPLYILVTRLGWINTWQALILPGLANSLVIFVFRQFFAEIPQDYLDSARVDGASWFRVLTSIILPMSLPVLVTTSLLLFMGQWNSFFWPLLVAPNAKFRVVQVAVSYAYEEHTTHWDLLLAGSVFAALVPIILVMPFQRYYVSGLVGGLRE
jgi:multiple sugar transport system permease protein